MNSQDKAKTLLEKLKNVDKLKAQLSELNKEVTVLSMDLHESMIEEDIPKLVINDNGIEIPFTPEVERSYSLDRNQVQARTWDDCTEWFAWLREIGEGGMIKTKETVHSGTRTAFLKQRIDEGKDIPGFVEEKFFNTVKFNKSAVKKAALAVI